MGSSKSKNIFDLYSYCPACNVKEQDGPSYWHHESCRKGSTINRQAYVGCNGTQEHCVTKPFIKWYWKCKNHRNEAKPVAKFHATAGLVRASNAISNASSGYPSNVWKEISSALVEQLEAMEAIQSK
mmetsp:Transcript_101798/g.124593  ORF Transcript_101798/g.124593 Transcript_101798/m.124593 type:complete len:127 (+) Transcript_101798:49-429(+)